MAVPETLESAVAAHLDTLFGGIDDEDDEEGATPEAEADDEVTADEAEDTGDAEDEGSEDEPDGQEEEEDAESEADAEASDEGTDDDVPLEYFGTDLSEFDAKARAAIIEMVKPRDQHIQQLLREKAADSKGDEPDGDGKPAEDAAPDEVTDEAILAELGLNPEEESEAAVKAVLGLARFTLGLKDEVTALRTKGELSETAAYWTTSLTSLEKQYGPLPPNADGTPMSHEDLMRAAADAGIAEPMDAYWRIQGPGRHKVMEEVRKRRDAAAQALKGKQRPVKPTSKTKTEEVDKVSGAADVADAVRRVMPGIMKDAGVR